MPQSDESHETGQQRTDEPTLTQIVSRLARAIAKLDPGSAAALRRGPLVGAGAAAFWKLVAKHAAGRAGRDEEGWAALFQAIAILTPKGTEGGERAADNPSIEMGAALYGANLSELRLARLLNARGQARRDLAIRLCRRLAGTDHRRFRLRTLANLILFSDATRHGEIANETSQRIARDYYHAQAKAVRETASEQSDTQETKSDA